MRMLDYVLVSLLILNSAATATIAGALVALVWAYTTP